MLKFKNGKLDENYLFQIVKTKTDIIREIFIMKKSLSFHANIIGEHKPTNSNDSVIIDLFLDQSNYQTKHFYNNILKLRITNFSNKYWNKFKMDNNLLTQYCILKIKKFKDRRIAEFHFKVLHNIIANNENLKKWKISNTELCDLCKETHDLEHLLFSCIKAQAVWKIIENLFKISIRFVDVIFCFKIDTYKIFSLCAYFLYKEWINRDNNVWTYKKCLNHFYNFIKYSCTLYQNIAENNFYIIQQLEAILEYLIRIKQ
jgi:hypothetical protein